MTTNNFYLFLLCDRISIRQYSHLFLLCDLDYTKFKVSHETDLYAHKTATSVHSRTHVS